MSWHYLQEQEGVCWDRASLDGAPNALLKLMPMPEASCLPGKEMGTLNRSRSGTMSARSTADRGEVQLMLFPGVFHVRTSQPVAKVRVLPAHVQDYFLKCCELLKKYNLDLSSRKTHQTCALEDCKKLSKGLTAWGMMSDGVFWELGTLARPIKGTECGSLGTVPTPLASKNLWPTPTVHGNNNRKGLTQKSGDGLSTSVKRQMWATPKAWDSRNILDPLAYFHRNSPPLSAAVHYWPTPLASDHRDRGNLSSPCIQRRKAKGKQISLSASVSIKSGQLNPTWVEWLMGWPLGWTDLEPLETDKYQQWLFLHLKS